MLGPVERGVVPGELQAEGRRLGMNAVAAAQTESVLVLLGPCAQRLAQSIEALRYKVARLAELHGQAGIQDVGGRHALMHEPRGRADMFGKVGQKGDHVMACLFFDFVDAFDLEGAMTPDRFGGLFRDDAKLGLRIGGMRLDLEPDAKAVLRLPDARHLGAAVAGDHLSTGPPGGWAALGSALCRCVGQASGLWDFLIDGGSALSAATRGATIRWIYTTSGAT